MDWDYAQRKREIKEKKKLKVVIKSKEAIDSTFDQLIERWRSSLVTNIFNRHQSRQKKWRFEKEKEKEREKVYALQTKYVCTHMHTKCLHHPLTAFALVAGLFFSSYFFTYAYSCARLTLMQSFLSFCLFFSLSLFSFSCLCTLLLLSHICLMCACVCVSLFRFSLPLSLPYSLHTHSDGDTRIEGRNLTKKEGRMRMHTRNRTQH